MVENSVTVLDNGAYSSKIGTSKQGLPKNIPNCIMKAKSERRRPFIGDQIQECRDASGLFYILCFQKGYLVNWDIQKTVWDYIFSQECCSTNFSDPIIVTEPQFNFTTIQEAMTEIFFEEYECETLMRTTAANLCAYNYFHETSMFSKIFNYIVGEDITISITAAATTTKTTTTTAGAVATSNKTSNNTTTGALNCCIVVDMGYSFTHIVPFIKGKRIKDGIRRIDVGGKMLTNHLKELISYRQLNVMDESYVINQVKEDACFVSQNFMNDMSIAKLRGSENTIIKEYVLPDFTSIRRGFLKDVGGSNGQNTIDNDQQSLRLTNERFVIPEILFHPSDVGIQQMGVCEAIMDSLKDCPTEAIPHLLPNVIVVGGCALFSGMETRIETELRTLAPNDVDVHVTVPKNPINYAWQGGVKLSENPDFLSMCMSREEYEEEGVRGAFDRFDI